MDERLKSAGIFSFQILPPPNAAIAMRRCLSNLPLVLCLLGSSGAFADPTRTPSFENDIEPLLARFSCNTSGCHGKAEGQNGFKLSVFGFDPDADYRAIVSEGRGRRVFPTSPERSLLLLKASGGVPHGGGVRIPPDRPEYATLRTWIAAGVPRGSADDPHVVKIEITPRERRMALGGQEQLKVTATWSDGREQDATGLARFQSNQEGLASVDENGLVSAGQTPGVVAVMASFMGEVDLFQAIIPRLDTVGAAPAEQNFIDGPVYRRLAQLSIAPAGVCDDATFLRRVYLDLIGTLPTAAEARSFAADTRPDRRGQLVDALLKRPEFNDYWALKFADLLRVDRQALGHKNAYRQYQWIQRSLAENKPLDQLAREIVTAEGPLAEHPEGYFFSTTGSPGKSASAVSQVFLGVRIECAECHHHPYDRWSQTDYYGMTAYFAQLQRKSSSLGEVLFAAGDPATNHPRTGQNVPAHALGQAMREKNIAGDRRVEFAKWLTASDNPFFARNWANRLWAHMLGRGVVEPVDDFRATNPPSNPELLEALAKSLVEQKYDLRAMLRTIAASRVYQHSSQPNATNETDEQNYSRFLLKRLDAEVLLDAVCQTTGVPEKFAGVPAGSRAIELWDSQVDHEFLRLFGRPTRQSVCECERVSEPSVAQVFHLLNSERVQDKLSREDGRVADLASRTKDDEQLIADLYVTFLSRGPTAEEQRRSLSHIQSARDAADRRERAEDLAWTLLNSLEFVFNH
jgi:hypothetical protein